MHGMRAQSSAGGYFMKQDYVLILQYSNQSVKVVNYNGEDAVSRLIVSNVAVNCSHSAH